MWCLSCRWSYSSTSPPAPGWGWSLVLDHTRAQSSSESLNISGLGVNMITCLILTLIFFILNGKCYIFISESLLFRYAKCEKCIYCNKVSCVSLWWSDCGVPPTPSDLLSRDGDTVQLVCTHGQTDYRVMLPVLPETRGHSAHTDWIYLLRVFRVPHMRVHTKNILQWRVISVEVEPRMALCLLETCLRQTIVQCINVLLEKHNAADPLCYQQKASSLLQEWFVCQSEKPASEVWIRSSNILSAQSDDITSCSYFQVLSWSSRLSTDGYHDQTSHKFLCSGSQVILLTSKDITLWWWY